MLHDKTIQVVDLPTKIAWDREQVHGLLVSTQLTLGGSRHRLCCRQTDCGTPARRTAAQGVEQPADASRQQADARRFALITNY
ncbi:MAG TPA: hypothetical protein DDY14_17650 [Chromatiaceae bacterium]|nr:hypothetical protein [Chromatiaceae bacterium]